MLLAWISFLLTAMVSPPAPQPSPPKTIITVHSSEFCTYLVLAVRPALVGLMRNDQLIDLGRSALVAGDRAVKFGGAPVSSFNQQGAAHWTTSEGDVMLLDARQRQLTAAIAQNMDMVQTVLANPNAPKPDGDDKAKLGQIRAQLDLILSEQRRATNIISGNAATNDLGGLYNAASATGIERDNYTPITPADQSGTSALNARLTSQDNVVPQAGKIKGFAATTDPTTASQAKINQAAGSNAFDSPYAKLVSALKIDQTAIGQTEQSASHAIIEAVEGCE